MAIQFFGGDTMHPEKEGPKPAAGQWPKTIILPSSGKTAKVLREPTGRDARMAQRMIGKNTDNAAALYALIAQVTEIDGHPIVWEDLLDFTVSDIADLSKACAVEAEEEDFDGNFLKAKGKQ